MALFSGRNNRDKPASKFLFIGAIGRLKRRNYSISALFGHLFTAVELF